MTHAAPDPRNTVCALCAPGGCTGACAGVLGADAAAEGAPPDARTFPGLQAPPSGPPPRYPRRDLRADPEPAPPNPYVQYDRGGRWIVGVLPDGTRVRWPISAERARQMADALTMFDGDGGRWQ